MPKHVVGIAVAMACLAIAVKAYVERKKTLRDNGNTYDTLLLRQKVCILLNRPYYTRCVLTYLHTLASTGHDGVASLRRRRR